MPTEFELINRLKNRLRETPSAAARTGIGDDCAVLPKDEQTDLVITTDLLIEDIDFRLRWTRPEFLGQKALAVSLSDVASMGAVPVWAMLSLGIPAKLWSTDFVDKFYDGWLALAAEVGVELIGGDISKTPDRLIIDSIAAGQTRRGQAVLRSGAQPGDLIFVTGSLGGAAAGLRLLENGERIESSEHQELLRRQLAPRPQSAFGQMLGAKGLATAMIDISDGLSSDLWHLCRASRVGAKLYGDQLPLDGGISRAAELTSRRLVRAKADPAGLLSFALNGGEDFELLFTVRPEKMSELEKELADLPFTRIGEIHASVETVELILNEELLSLEPRGFRHF